MYQCTKDQRKSGSEQFMEKVGAWDRKKPKR